MTFRDGIKGVGIALALLTGCIPIAIILTILASPFWSWLEKKAKIEAYGHSGPAEWCYLAAYGLLVAFCALIWSYGRRRKGRP